MAGKGISFRFPRSSGGGGISHKIDEGRTDVRKNFDGTTTAEPVQRSSYDGGGQARNVGDYKTLPLPNERIIINTVISEPVKQEPATTRSPITNSGINFRSPRNSGGRFYSDRVDEGRSRLYTEIGYIQSVSVIQEVSPYIFTWNKVNTNEFNSGTFVSIGNPLTGSATISYFSGTVDSEVGARALPETRITLSTTYTSSGSVGGASGSLLLLPIETGPLPKRYEIYMSFRIPSASPTPMMGIYFGANQITGSDISNFHGSAIIWGAPAGNFANKSVNITTGTIGRWRVATGTGEGVSNVWVIRLLIETKSTTGSLSGSVWRARNVSHPHYNGGQSTTVWENEMSGSNSSWVAAGNIDRMGLIFGRMSASSTQDTFTIQELTIRKHPRDEE